MEAKQKLIYANFDLYLDFFLCLIYNFWFYKSRFDMKRTSYLII